MMNQTELKAAIRGTALAKLNAKKTRAVPIYTYTTNSDGSLKQELVETRMELPTDQGAVEALIDSIAEAVAQEVIEHLKAKLSLRGGSATFVAQSGSGTWTGKGGGVVGPVLVDSVAGASGTETLSITQGSFE